jgi:hypothetical protein
VPTGGSVTMGLPAALSAMYDFTFSSTTPVDNIKRRLMILNHLCF